VIINFNEPIIRFSPEGWGIDMAELFFQFKTVPYLFDTEILKLFRLENNRIIEIIDREIFRNIRFNSIEIDRNHAFRRSLKVDTTTL
jgi:hypothetical protein